MSRPARPVPHSRHCNAKSTMTAMVVWHAKAGCNSEILKRGGLYPPLPYKGVEAIALSTPEGHVPPYHHSNSRQRWPYHSAPHLQWLEIMKHGLPLRYTAGLKASQSTCSSSACQCQKGPDPMSDLPAAHQTSHLIQHPRNPCLLPHAPGNKCVNNSC